MTHINMAGNYNPGFAPDPANINHDHYRANPPFQANPGAVMPGISPDGTIGRLPDPVDAFTTPASGSVNLRLEVAELKAGLAKSMALGTEAVRQRDEARAALHYARALMEEAIQQRDEAVKALGDANLATLGAHSARDLALCDLANMSDAYQDELARNAAALSALRVATVNSSRYRSEIYWQVDPANWGEPRHFKQSHADAALASCGETKPAPFDHDHHYNGGRCSICGDRLE